MNVISKFSFLLISLFIFNISLAQTISGIVKSNTEPLPFANVILKDTSNSIITGTTSSYEGLFELKCQPKSYILEVSYLGYKTWTQNILVKKSINIGDIILEENNQGLEEVVITAEKRVIERKIDRLVFNVEKSIATTGGNGLDVLRATPGVQLNNDVLSILGKGATQVMINGRLSPLEGEELISFLNGFSANDIVKVEVITNPPARYDAAGNGGLINIVLKKGIQNSWKNSTVYSYNQNRYNFSSIGNNFLYNKRKLSLSSSLNASKGFVENLEGLQISYPQNFWDIDIDGKINKDQLSGRFLMDYSISDNTVLGVQYLGNTATPSIQSNVASNIFDNNANPERFLSNKVTNGVDNQNHSINFHAISIIDSIGKQVSLDVDYFTFNSDRTLDFFTEQYDNENTFEGITFSAISFSNQKIENLSSKIDMELPLDKINLSYGFKASFTNTASGLQFFNTLSGQPILDSNQSNDFNYEENVWATYISGRTNISRNLKVQFGLRFEDTRTTGFNISLAEENKNNYSKLFPSLHLSYQQNDNNSFNLSYGRRINRPNFRNLNPFRFYISENNYSVGNPFLQPSFSDNIEISHLYKNKLNSNLSLSITTNGFGVFFDSDPVNQDQVITRENYFTKYVYRLEEQFSFNKFSWWESRNSVNLLAHITQLTKDLDAENNNGIQFYAESSNSFIINEKTQIQINAWYSSFHNDGLFSFGEMLHLSFGMRHNFKENLQLSILFSDVLNKGSLRNLRSNVNGIEQNYRQNESSRNLRISLSYNFGNNKIRVKNRSFGNDTEQRRSR